MKQVATILFSVGLTLLILVAVWEIAPYIDQAMTVTTSEKSPITITTKEKYTHNIYRIHISTTCLQNSSVGNEWYVDYNIAGEKIYDGEKISVPIDVEKIIIDVNITEKDKGSDTSEKAVTLDLSNPEPTTKTQITVIEDSGRYRGNTAIWEVSISAELIEKE